MATGWPQRHNQASSENVLGTVAMGRHLPEIRIQESGKQRALHSLYDRPGPPGFSVRYRTFAAPFWLAIVRCNPRAYTCTR